MMTSGCGAMAMLKTALTEAPALSVSWAVNVNVPGVDGVPEITPALFSASPLGSDPAVMLQE
jgi:hypothetical protein